MKLNTVKQALELLLATNLTKQDRQDAFQALKEVHDTLERATDNRVYRDEAYMISASNTTDILVNGLYPVYADLHKIYGDNLDVDNFKYRARKELGFEDFTNEQLQIGYEVIADLWQDNEAAGTHDENGLIATESTGKVKLTLSSAECNCLIEAITVANEQVCAGKVVYCRDGYMSEDSQISYATVTVEIADALMRIIDDGETATILFEP